MQVKKLSIRRTLAAIRVYKTQRHGNFETIFRAAKMDAWDAIGWNPAFLKIEERKAGRPLSFQENVIFNYCYDTAVKDAIRLIINRAFAAIPESIKNCTQFKSI